MKAVKAARASSDFSRSRKIRVSSSMRAISASRGATHQLARDPDRLRGLRGDPVGGRQHRCLEHILLDDLVDQSSGFRPLGGKALAESEHREGQLPAGDRRHEQTRARLRDEPKIDERRAKDGSRRGEGKVAMQVERRADTDRDAVDTGNDRLFDADERHQEIPDLGAVIAAGGHGEEIGDIRPGGERARGSQEDVSADRWIGVALRQRRRHPCVHGSRESVFLVRPIEADDLNGALALDENMVCHGRSLESRVFRRGWKRTKRWRANAGLLRARCRKM